MKTTFPSFNAILGLFKKANRRFLVYTFSLIFSISSYAHAIETYTTTGLFPCQRVPVDTEIVIAGLVRTDISSLPLHRLELKTVLHGSSVDLIWIAENEMNTSRFIIQRSIDGITYSDIGKKAAAGQTYMPTEYRSQDDIQSLMTNSSIYYRIRAEDIDDRFGYSNIAPVKLGTITGIQVWPSPFTSELRISYAAAAGTTLDIHIVDNTGRNVKQNIYNISRGLNQLSVSGIELLSSGVYFISVTDKNTNKVYVQKLTK